MIHITKILILLISLYLFPFQGNAAGMQSSAATDTLGGILLDANTGEPVPRAHVFLEETENGVTSGPDGRFLIRIPGKGGTLSITHIAYRTERIQIGPEEIEQSLAIRLQPGRISNEELVVSAGRFRQIWSGVYSNTKTRPVEDHMQTVSGLDMVTRANIAKDPVIRGMRNGRVNVLIDGMRMTPACVDGMDPATAYVESDNLRAIEISRGQEAQPVASTAPGGSVNFAMARPVLNSGFSGNVETGYHTASLQRLIQSSAAWGGGQWAFRVSGTYRKAGDLQSGNGNRVSGSGFEKGNLFTSVLFEPGDNHRFSLRYIADLAGKMGYPRLIMDTRRAEAHIGGLEHTWNVPSETIHSVTTSVYMNRVEHRMDDYDRNVSQRDVMRNMHMPMYGETLTTGATSELSASAGNHLVNLKLDFWAVDAFADMTMEHLNPEVSDMYLINLGDVSQRHVVISASWRRFAGNGWMISLNGQLETGANRLREKSARATYRAEYPGLDDPDPSAAGYLAGVGVEKRISDFVQTGLRVSDGQRLPDHMERYGYYIYQPLDGFFYYGNPALETERSRQAEIWVRLGNDNRRLNGNMSFWVNRMDNYIAGLRMDEPFKRYENIGTALLTGFETDLNLQLNRQWQTGTSMSWVAGHHRELNEPLPMIPPLKGAFFLQRETDVFSLETRLRWAAAQSRIARQNSLENHTPAYALWDIYARFRLFSDLEVQAGAENILDTFYTDHLSVNDMPGAGRNIRISLRMSL